MTRPDAAAGRALGTAPRALADAVDDALPQTQCTRCGEPDCRGYAEAIAAGLAPIDRCPPGGAAGVLRLAAITGLAPRPIDPAHGVEGPRRAAFIEEAACIGCALCIKACPVDCIVGAAKHMHTVIESQCTGCELCVPACPVDCISLENAQAGDDPPTGWAAWSPQQAAAAKLRYAARSARETARSTRRAGPPPRRAALASPGDEQRPLALAPPDAEERKRAAVEEALRRARARRGTP